MPRKKTVVKREIQRIAQTASSAQEAAQAAHEVAEELDRKSVTEEVEKPSVGLRVLGMCVASMSPTSSHVGSTPTHCPSHTSAHECPSQ